MGRQGEITEIMFDYWALATTQPFGDRVASEHLERQGFEPYAPRELVLRAIRGRKVEDVQPLFPGYIFVKLNPRWRSIFGTRGVSGLILDGDPTSETAVPMRIRSSEIDRIRSSEVDGVIITKPRERARRRFSAGEQVRVKRDAALGNQLGVFAGQTRQDRLKVLFQMLGREVAVWVRESDLVAV